MGEVYLSLRGGLYSTNYYKWHFFDFFYYKTLWHHSTCDNDS